MARPQPTIPLSVPGAVGGVGDTTYRRGMTVAGVWAAKTEVSVLRLDNPDCGYSTNTDWRFDMASYFAFQQRPGQEFIFELTDEKKIAHARRILSGEEKESVHVMGRIIKRPASYNPKWSFHLDPGTIDFFAMAIEVCDADMQYVEDHLDEACGAFLPGCHWCPWSSKLVREVDGPAES